MRLRQTRDGDPNDCDKAVCVSEADLPFRTLASVLCSSAITPIRRGIAIYSDTDAVQRSSSSVPQVSSPNTAT